MHDPSHVVFSIRRPPLQRPRRTRGNTRGFAFWTLRDATTIGRDGEPQRTPLRRRVMFSGAFFRLGRWEWFLPAVVTVWHRDPESDGSDSSCRNAARRRRQEAIKQHRFLAAAWWDWWWRHFDAFHVHHWTVQVDVAQELRRRLFTRCATCGGRSTGKRIVNAHVVVDRDAEDRAREQRRTFRGRWLTGEVNLHHWDCAPLAQIRATKANLPSWLAQWGHDRWCMDHQRKREPYMGCYPWWREAILGEDPQTAAALAAAHVQRACAACGPCAGTGIVDVRDAARSTADTLAATAQTCDRCQGTGHPPVDRPIPAEAV